ncbi:uncharacterized protein FFB14_13421 [Fusarium fujikuroi]|nr:uncharacterized protein FFB14_13421 [Fusarium fujikuroi]
MNQTSNRRPKAGGVNPLDTVARRAYLRVFLQYHRIWDEPSWEKVSRKAEEWMCGALTQKGYRSISLVFFDHSVDEYAWEEYLARFKFEDPYERCWPWKIEPEAKNMAGGICHFYKNWREQKGMMVDGPHVQAPTIDPMVAYASNSA